MDPAPHRGSPSQPQPTTDNHIHNNITDQNQHRVRFAEGEPQATYTVHQPTSRRGTSPAATASAAQPSVFWDERGGPDRDIDRESDANLAGYTFYREGTPTPPDYESPEKRMGYHAHGPIAENSTIGGGTAGSDRDFNLGPLHHQDDRANWSVADSNEMSPAARKRTRWVLIALGIFVLVGVAVGVGLGVGLSKGKGAVAAAVQTPSSSLPASAVETNPTTTSPPTATAAGSEGATDTNTTTGSAASPRPTYNSDCPALNNTIYHVPGSTKSFLRQCGIDYSGTGATDLVEAYTESMADCMNSCASFDQCTACSWGYLQGDQGDKHRCYMKKALKQKHSATSDWCFAILQT